MFAKIGLFTFGGGYAMLALIEDQCVERKRWLTHDDLAAVTAIAESTPGPIAINCATYTGYRQAGLLGAVCATLGLVLPSFVIIYLISLFFDRFLDIPLVANAFWGIKAGVGVLMVQAGVNMLLKLPKKPLPLSLMALGLVGVTLCELLAARLSVVWLLVTAALASMAACGLKRQNAHKEAGA